MARRLLVILIELGVACIFIVAGVLFWLSYYIDTDDFRLMFTDGLQSFIGRKVELRGELNIDLWPGINLEIEDLSIADDPDFGPEPFASFERILINVNLIKLLSERLEVRSVVIENMDLSLAHESDGQSNWQSIIERMTRADPTELPVDYTLKEVKFRGLEVVNASIRFRTGQDQAGIALNGINLKTGSIVPGRDIPFSISSALSYGDGIITSDVTLLGMFEAGVDGADIAVKDATVNASIGGTFLPKGARPGELTAHVVLDWDKRTLGFDELRARFLGLRVEGYFESGDFSESLSGEGHITVYPFKPAKIISRYWPRLPVKSVNGLRSGAFASFFHADETGIEFREIVAVLDDVNIRGRLGIEGFSSPVLSFGLRANEIDLDRYLPLFMTGTPFIWDDFGLAFFRRFRGQGAIQADGLKVLDTLISDVRLSAKGDRNSIRLDVGALSKGLTALGGNADVRIGRNEKDGNPTLAMNVNITAQSDKDGFPFLQGDGWRVGGVGNLKMHARVNPLVCPPADRSIDILRFLETKGSVSLGKGKAGLKDGDGTFRQTDYDDAELHFETVPKAGDQRGYYKFQVTGSAKAFGGKASKDAAIAFSGPVTAAVDEFHILSPGLSVKGHLAGFPLPQKVKRVNGGGMVVFDTKESSVTIVDGAFNGLDTRIKATADITGLDESFKATGRVEIVEVNPKRIIYLLTGKTVQTADAQALTDAGLSANYVLDEDGFTVNGLSGRLDSMNFQGHVIGDGLANPMLAFSLNCGQFDLDRYLPPSREMTPEERRSGVKKKAPPVELPFGFLRALRLNGKVFFDEFKLAKVRAQSLTGLVRVDKGRIHVSEVKGTVHGGVLTADWKGDVASNALTTDLLLHIEDMQAGPLMLDMAKREYIRGLADVDFDLKSGGSTDDDIVANLQGKAWIRVNNGSFKFTGYDVKPASRSNVNKNQTIGSTQRPRSNRTSFRKAVSYYTVMDGVFTVDKFRLEAPPLLQSYGKGGFSLPANTIDLSIRNDFVAVPSVTIHLVGSLSDPQVKIPTGKILNNTVRNILSLPEKSFNFLRDLFQ